ncbi:MAG: hypothetical protein KDA86_11665 [Planctomycetaceae bacterium]|nr:hypothetical protein [Planctomycetaceae bacterium]MCA9110927.1 hypothetical protein [Planctomycetaceae bacterium]
MNLAEPMPQTNARHHSDRHFQFGMWVFLRVLVPVLVAGVMVYLTRGHRFFDIFGPLVWTLFVTHLVGTFAFGRSHVLDTGSFFFLIVTSIATANMSERYQFDHVNSWVSSAVFTLLYLTFSIVGRYRADRSINTGRPVSMLQVAMALCLLLVAVILCSSSKTAVGFLFVPGLLVIPVILFWSLVSRGQNSD